MSDFHFDSLVRFEAQQAVEDHQPAASVNPTYWVTTSDWEQHCLNTEELGEMISSALMENLKYSVELCPF